MHDIAGACASLKRALHRAKFDFTTLRSALGRGIPIDTALARGNSSAFVPMLRHALCTRSSAVARAITNRGHDLVGVDNALRFTERAFRATIDVFGYKPKASALQFTSDSGFARVKIAIVSDVLALVETMDIDFARRERDRRRRERPGVVASLTAKRWRALKAPRTLSAPLRAMIAARDDIGHDEDEDGANHGRVHELKSHNDVHWRRVPSPSTYADDIETSFQSDDYDDVYDNSHYDEDGDDEEDEMTSHECRHNDAREIVTALRLEFAEVLGRVTRVEKELAVANARCAALERRNAAVDDIKHNLDTASPTVNTHTNRSVCEKTTPHAQETTNSFIERYVRKLRECSDDN